MAVLSQVLSSGFCSIILMHLILWDCWKYKLTCYLVHHHPHVLKRFDCCFISCINTVVIQSTCTHMYVYLHSVTGTECMIYCSYFRTYYFKSILIIISCASLIATLCHGLSMILAAKLLSFTLASTCMSIDMTDESDWVCGDIGWISKGYRVISTVRIWSCTDGGGSVVHCWW